VRLPGRRGRNRAHEIVPGRLRQPDPPDDVLRVLFGDQAAAVSRQEVREGFLVGVGERDRALGSEIDGTAFGRRQRRVGGRALGAGQAAGSQLDPAEITSHGHDGIGQRRASDSRENGFAGGAGRLAAVAARFLDLSPDAATPGVRNVPAIMVAAGHLRDERFGGFKRSSRCRLGDKKRSLLLDFGVRNPRDRLIAVGSFWVGHLWTLYHDRHRSGRSVIVRPQPGLAGLFPALSILACICLQYNELRGSWHGTPLAFRDALARKRRVHDRGTPVA
jgi:hypothetical protein